MWFVPGTTKSGRTHSGGQASLAAAPGDDHPNEPLDAARIECDARGHTEDTEASWIPPSSQDAPGRVTRPTPTSGRRSDTQPMPDPPRRPFLGYAMKSRPFCKHGIDPPAMARTFSQGVVRPGADGADACIAFSGHPGSLALSGLTSKRGTEGLSTQSSPTATAGNHYSSRPPRVIRPPFLDAFCTAACGHFSTQRAVSSVHGPRLVMAAELLVPNGNSPS